MFKHITAFTDWDKDYIPANIKNKYYEYYNRLNITYVRLTDTDFTVEFASLNKWYVQDIIYIYESKKLNVAKNLYLFFKLTNFLPGIMEFEDVPEYDKYIPEIKKYLLWS